MAGVEKAVAYTQQHSSLKWYDYIFYRVLNSFKGVTEESIEAGDMADLLKKNEYLDMRDFIEAADERERKERQRIDEMNAAKKKRR